MTTIAASFAYHDTVRECIDNRGLFHSNPTDWLEWRCCYNAGATFRQEYLKKFLGKEDTKAFERRKDLTPIPSFAKNEIKKVKNALSQRLCDVSRSGGSNKWQDAVNGVGRGIDRRGSEMNAFISKKILAELLVMGEVGVLVNAPHVENLVSQADVPKEFTPYLHRFPVERMPILIKAPNDSPSDYAHVLIETQKRDYNMLSGKDNCIKEWRYYWLEDDELERFGKVNVAFLNDKSELTRPIFKSNLDAIPFVVFDIDQSLMEDACSHQIVLLNMISADSNYSIDANYSILTRQRGIPGQEGTHLDGSDGDDTRKAGATRGMYYQRGSERPGFISPGTGPMMTSLELRRELKKEIEDLVRGNIKGLSDDGSIEAGLAFIGSGLQLGERRLWDHWTVFEETRESRRKIPTIHYPDTWSLKSDEQRVDEAKKFLELANLMSGQLNKKSMQIHAADRMHRGRKSVNEFNAIVAEIMAAPYSIADPAVIIKAKKEGCVSIETSALALGFDEGEGDKAKADAAAKQAAVVQAQKDMAQAGQGNVDGQIDAQSDKIAKADDDSGRPEETNDKE